MYINHKKKHRDTHKNTHKNTYKNKIQKKKQFLKKPIKCYYTIHIQTTFNNTLINLTNSRGDTIAWASGGSIGLKNARKKGTYVARQVGHALGRKCRKKKIKKVEVKVRGLGYAKKNAIRGIKSSGVKIKKIHEATGIPYNGCRVRKKRRKA